jgi:hypothetical protein
MRHMIILIGAVLLVAATATGAMAYGEQVFENSQYATSAEAGWFYVVDQNNVKDTWT